MLTAAISTTWALLPCWWWEVCCAVPHLLFAFSSPPYVTSSSFETGGELLFVMLVVQGSWLHQHLGASLIRLFSLVSSMMVTLLSLPAALFMFFVRLLAEGQIGINPIAVDVVSASTPWTPTLIPASTDVDANLYDLHALQSPEFREQATPTIGELSPTV
ncbi:hypothetical protein Taro_033054 [Colocasia esculenta]|uniref:Uncharacterized protein n=1 Tax=Colocasia esculenta TaxID=4460 RepID=A0A843W5T3_COLES|nr:hypothetical protein [Colocasia esculenta]